MRGVLGAGGGEWRTSVSNGGSKAGPCGPARRGVASGPPRGNIDWRSPGTGAQTTSGKEGIELGAGGQCPTHCHPCHRGIGTYESLLAGAHQSCTTTWSLSGARPDECVENGVECAPLGGAALRSCLLLFAPPSRAAGRAQAQIFRDLSDATWEKYGFVCVSPGLRRFIP